MNIELIRKQLTELERLTKEWELGDEISIIERDIALDKVKSLYEELRFADNTILSTESLNVEDQEAEIEVELTYYEGEDEDVQETSNLDTQEEEQQQEVESQEQESMISINLDDILILDEDEILDTPTPREEAKPVAENSLFDMDTIPITPKSRRSAILSLYSDSVSSQTPSSDSSAPRIIAEEDLIIEEIDEDKIIDNIIEEEVEVNTTPQTIAETMTPATQTIADMYIADSATLSDSATPCSSINDRYIIAQKLFGGDTEACDEMLTKLETFDNFDDCMIYIVENYEWDPDCEAVKLVIKFLETKYPFN